MEGECHRRFALLLLRRHKVGSPRKQECLARLASYLAVCAPAGDPNFWFEREQVEKGDEDYRRGE